MVKLLWENIFKSDQDESGPTAALRSCPIFSALTHRELKFVSKVIHARTYRPGEAIFTQNEVGLGMYMLVKGTINISIEEFKEDEPPKLVFITRLDPGDFFGEISLVENNGRRTATAIAADEVLVYGFFKPDLNDIAERNPLIGYKIVSKLSEVLGRRLQETARKVALLKKEVLNPTNKI
ncbi:MAG: cyclic nucleotide-binding domain-containing protein [Bdellovibrionales bacterium]|nr:cyclic nucleotide-binding domain-containing protein [Bdellovibrionales bacterium]